MEVILKEDVAKLGARGDVVKVAEGYGRNFLLPRKLAIEATTGNKAVIVQMKAASVRRSAKEKSQAEELAKQFDGISVSFERKAGEHEKGNQPGPAQDPAPRAAENRRRVHRSGQAAQRRDGALEGGHRERSGRRGVDCCIFPACNRDVASNLSANLPVIHRTHRDSAFCSRNSGTS